MLSPKRTKFRKMQKGNNRGVAHAGSDVSFGDFALQAMEPARVTSRQIEAANVAPIAFRDELRRRLEAYRSKVSHLRLLEEPELAAVHARAQRVLYTAPTDLGEAADLVRRYQAGLSSRANPEIVR